MKEQLISFKTAELAKEKGFLEYCENFYSSKGILNESTGNEITYLAPTQSLLQKWLRENHNIHIDISMQYNVWFYSVNKIPFNHFKDNDIVGGTYFSSYEKALEKGLYEALKLI